MTISYTAKFLTRQIVLGNCTYLEVIGKKPELKDQIDAYIEEQGLDVDKTK